MRVDPGHRTAVGLFLAFLGYLWFRVLGSFGFPAFDLFALGANVVTVGLLVAALGAGGLALGRGKRPLMAGFLLLGAGYAAMALTSTGGLTFLAHLLVWSSGLLAAWAATMRVVDPASREATRFGQLRIAMAAATAGLAVYVLLGLDDPVYVLAPLLGTLGFALATDGFGRLRDRAAAEDAKRRGTREDQGADAAAGAAR